MRSSATECEMGVGRARHIERVGFGEHVLVAIRRAVEHDHLLTGADRTLAHDDVVHRRAPEVDDRCRHAQHLFDRRCQQPVEVTHQPRPLLGMIEEQLHPGGDEVARRVPAGVDEQQEEPLELGVGELVAIDGRLHQRRRDVVARRAALVLGDLLRVRQHLADRRHLPLQRGDGVVGRVHDLGQLVQPLAVFAADAHQLGDEAGRQATGDVVDKIARTVLDHVVDDVGSELGDTVRQQLRVARREAATDEQLEPIVLRRIHRQHHLPLRGETSLVGLLHHHATLVGAERRRLPADHPDVVVLGHRPEAGTIDLVVPVHGIVRPQPRVLTPRVPIRERRRRGEINHRHRARPPYRAGSLHPVGDEGEAVGRCEAQANHRLVCGRVVPRP